MDDMASKSANEQLLSEIVSFVSSLSSNLESIQLENNLSKIINKYYVKIIEPDTTHPDLKDKIDLYLAAKKLEGLSRNTLNGYQLELRIFSNHVRKHVKDITTADIRIYLSKFDHLKTSSIGKKVAVSKSFFGWLTSEEIIQRDPCLKIKSPKIEKLLPKALSIEELEMLRESCKTIRQRAFIEILYATGCRLSEVYQLNKSDINFQTMSCRVIGKGNKEREVYFSFKAIYHLRKYLMARADHEEALMITERKPYRRLSRRGIQREISIIAKNAGIEHKVSPHVLRHTFATLTLNNGAELVAVQELLGHSSPDTTLRYARITEERKREQHKKYLIQ